MSEVVGTSGTLFAPIQAPRLKSISRKAIQSFLAERMQYEAAVQAQPGINAISWAGCFDAIFLRSLIRARIFGAEVKDVTDLTDSLIKSKLEELSGTSKSTSYEEALADVKRNCRLDSSEPDARIRILMLQTSYIELCERRGWKFYENAQKAAIKQICSVLQPPELKTRVQDAIKLEKYYLEDDFFGFMEYLQEEAAICERFKPLRSSISGSKGGPSHASERKSGHGASSWSSSKPSRAKANPPACLNPKCGGKHLVKNCPMTSADEKARLLSEFKSNYKSTGIKAKKEKSVSFMIDEPDKKKKDTSISSSASSTSEPAVVLANLHGFNFACRIDSGADDNVISDTIVTFLGDQGIYLPTLRQSKDRRFKAIDGHAVKPVGKVQVCPTLKTVAGPCRLRNINAHIMPCSDKYVVNGAACSGELVLGNPFLIYSGLDVKDFRR